MGRSVAGGPTFAKSAGPIRICWFKDPAFERLAGNVRRRAQRLWRRQRLGRVSQSLHPLPERRKDPQAPAVLVADAVRGSQEIAGQAVGGDADGLEVSGDLAGHRLIRSLRDIIPEYGAST